MADDFSERIDRPQSAMDKVARLNLLDIVQERARNFNKKSLIHCLIYVGRLNSEHQLPQELADHYGRLIKNYASHLNAEVTTGLLLIYPKHFVHIVEGPENTLFDIIGEIGDDNRRSPVIDETKILVFSHDIPSRLFMQWSCRILNLASVRMDESKIQDSVENKVNEALNLILKLTKELCKFPILQLQANLDQLTTKFQNLLLPQDLIEALLKSKELLSMSEYLDKYCKALDITLDDELVWPLQMNLPQM